jgi:hypothetical protein
MLIINAMSEKITGYMLLFAGLIVIIWSAVNFYFVATGKTKPVSPVLLPPITLDMGPLVSGVTGTSSRGGQAPSLKTELIPASSINTVFSLMIHFFLMGFISTVGFRISSLGIQLLRPTEIKIKDTNKG